MTAGAPGGLVLELGSGPATALAAALLESVGWDAVKVEPPFAGDPLRRRFPRDADGGLTGESLLFAAFNRGKRSVALDLGSDAGRALAAQISRHADVVLCDDDALAAFDDGPRLEAGAIVCVGDFGAGGPYAGWRMSDLTWSALVGLAHATPPGPIDPEELREPLTPGAELHEPTTGIAAAFAAMALALGPPAGDRPAFVRLNHHEVAQTLPILENVYSHLALGEDVARGSARMRYAPLVLMPCADGWVYVQCHDETTWERFVDLMGRPEWAGDPRFVDKFARYEHWHALEPLLRDWLERHTRAEIFALCKDAGLPFAPVQGMEDIARSEQVAHRGLIATFTASDGRALRGPELPPRVAGIGVDRGAQRTPRVGEHTRELLAELADLPPQAIDDLLRTGVASATEAVGAVGATGAAEARSEGPAARRAATQRPADRHDGSAPTGWSRTLAGLRVLDFTIIWAGPWVTRLLASCGAEVLRVESRKRPEITRVVPPFVPGLPELESGIEHQIQNRGKRSLALNLKHPRARDVAGRLAAASDVVVQNFKPGVAARLGIDFDALREANPSLIMLSLSGYGADGPDAHAGAAGSGVLAYSGATALTGYDDDRPHTLGTSWPDQAAGLTGAFCILSLLRRRALGEPPQATHVELALNDVMAMLIAEPLMAWLDCGVPTERRGNRSPRALVAGCYPARGEDAWLAVSVEDPQALDRLRAALSANGAQARGFQPDRETWDEHLARLDGALAAWASERTPRDGAAALQRHGVAAAPVLDGRGIVEDPQLAARGYWESREHPAGAKLRLPRFDVIEGELSPAATAPLLGADTELACREWLGMEDAEIERLVAEGALR